MKRIEYKSLFIRSYAVAVVVLFAGVHSPMLFMLQWYDRMVSGALDAGYLSQNTGEYLAANKELIFSNFIVPFKTLLFIAALVIVVYPLYRTISVYRSPLRHKWINKETVLTVLFSFGILCLLVFPWRLCVYGEMSYNPFDFRDNKMWYYQRILSPALAYVLQMKGPWLFLIFSLCCTVLLLWVIYVFFLERNIVLSRIELISIGTSSFVMSQLYLPGHPEQIVYALMLLLFILPADTISRLSIVVLCILTHETSIVPISLLALFYFTKEEQIKTGMIIACYGLFWLLSFGMDVPTLLAVRNVSGENGLSWMLRFPFREFLGIAISLKLLWFVVALAVLKRSEDRMAIVGFVVIALLFTSLGVDTSRLMGFSIVALVLAYYWMKKENLINPRLLRYLVVGNILLPSFYVCTQTGMMFINGIFQHTADERVVIANGLYQIFYLGFLF